MSAKPTRVAMDDWQLQDLKKAEAAVEVQKKANPVKQEVKRPETKPPERRGIERRAPIAGGLARWGEQLAVAEEAVAGHLDRRYQSMMAPQTSTRDDAEYGV